MKRMPLELGLELNINALIRGGLIEPGATTQLQQFRWFDGDGEPMAEASISAAMTPSEIGEFRIVADWINQTVRLVASPRPFGGVQWYFQCPTTARRASVLWSPPRKRYFASRQAWGKRVAYLSQFVGPASRAAYMAEKLCTRIGGPGLSDDWIVPPKPKGMHLATYQRLAARCENYNARATSLPRRYCLEGPVV